MKKIITDLKGRITMGQLSYAVHILRRVALAFIVIGTVYTALDVIGLGLPFADRTLAIWGPLFMISAYETMDGAWLRNRSKLNKSKLLLATVLASVIFYETHTLYLCIFQLVAIFAYVPVRNTWGKVAVSEEMAVRKSLEAHKSDLEYYEYAIEALTAVRDAMDKDDIEGIEKINTSIARIQSELDHCNGKVHALKTILSSGKTSVEDFREVL